jgi:hypothetical protein
MTCRPRAADNVGGRGSAPRTRLWSRGTGATPGRVGAGPSKGIRTTFGLLGKLRLELAAIGAEPPVKARPELARGRMNTREGRGATRSVLPAVLARLLARCRPPAAAAADVAAAGGAQAPDAVSAAVADFDSRPASGAPAGVRSPGIHYIAISRACSVGAPAVGNVTCSTILAIAAVVGGAAGAATDAVNTEAG